jgi:uncharacterized membrane protein YbhN (UPF0104 family)
MALCGGLLLWIFHSIFVDEARRSTVPSQWRQLSRTEQWRKGWSEGPTRLWRTVSEIEPRAFGLSVVLMGGVIVLGVVRWRMVLQVQGLDLSFGRALEITLVAHFFNSFLLGATGGDLMKAYYAARETHHRKTEAVVTVFVDRLVGLWAMVLFAGLMMIPNAAWLLQMDRVGKLAALVIVGMLAGCSLILGLAFWGGLSRRWAGARGFLRRLPKGAWLERSLDSCRRFGKTPFFLVRTLAISMALNALVVLQWWVVGRGLGLAISFDLLMMVVPMVICIAALPVTPSGLGVRENLFVHLLHTVVPAARALSLSLLAFAGSMVWSLIGGVVYLLLRDRHHLAEKELSASTGD